MNKKISLAVAFAVTLFLSNSAFSAPCELGPPPEGATNKPPVCDSFGPPPFPPNISPKCMEKMKKEHEKRKAEFDKRLNLSDAQKATIEKNRAEDRVKMKPLFEDMKAKKLKIQEVYNSNLSKEEKDKQISELKSQLTELKKKAHVLREENMKKFEEILTPAQKKEFEKMKKEHKKDKDKTFNRHKRMMPPPCFK